MLLALTTATLLAGPPTLEALVHDNRKLNLPLRAAIDYALDGGEGHVRVVDSQLLDAGAKRLEKRFNQALDAHRRERPKASAKRRDALADIGRAHLAELRQVLVAKTKPGFERARKLIDVIDLDFDDLLMLR